MANTIFSEIQRLSQDSPWVELFTLDTSMLGGLVYNFTPNIGVYANGNNAPISFANTVYAPLPMAINGWEVMATSGSGSTQPRPTISVSNVNRTLLSAVIALGDLVGSKFTRVRTFNKFLDGMSEANPSEFIGPDVYTVNQKTGQTSQQITWQLCTALDIPNAQLPARQVLKGPSLLDPSGFPGVQTY